MAIENWSDQKFENLMVASTIVYIILIISALIAFAWYTNVLERELMVKNKYQECLVYVPGLQSKVTLLQKECQVIKPIQ